MPKKIFKAVVGVAVTVAGFFLPGVGQLLAQAVGLSLLSSVFQPALPDVIRRFTANDVQPTNEVPIAYGRTVIGLREE